MRKRIYKECRHPHIFRVQAKDPYRCLACGEYMIVVPQSEVEPSSTLMNIKIKQPRAKS